MPIITFLKEKKSIKVKEGTDLVRLPYLNATLPIKFGCCQGECGTCAIHVIEGQENLSPKTKQEKITLAMLKLQDPHRLACQCSVKGDIVIDR